MDVNGAKALKERLAKNGAEEAAPASTDVEVSEHAPPVYHWLGVSRKEPEAPAVEEDDPPARNASLFQRLGLSFR
jgi:hypothetical protein